jgi:thiamine-monophosphate kinase
MLSEFSLIDRFFARRAAAAPRADDGSLGIGDDCALLAPRRGEMLAISTDMLVEGRHFFADVDPEALGHKALAVNLSDLAAMGARPQAFTLAFSLPKADEAWLAAFSEGLFALA